MIRRVLFVVRGLMLIGGLSVTQAWALREEQLPDLVRQGNGEVKAASRFLESARSRMGHLRRSYLPDVTARAGGESFKTGTFEARREPFGSIDAELNLYRGGRDRLEEEHRRAKIQNAQAEYDVVFFDQLSQARELFWILVFQREMLGFLKGAFQENEAMLAAANRRIQGGLATDTDGLEFGMHESQLKQDLARLTLDGKRAERRLRALLGFKEDEPLNIPEVVPHEHHEDFVTVPFNPAAHRQVRTLRNQREATALESRQQNRWWTPALDLYGDYSLYTFREREYDARNDRDEVVGGARISMAFFDGGQARSRARGLTLQAKGQAEQMEQTVRLVQNEFVSLQEELRSLHDLIHSAERGAEQGKSYLQRTRSEYARGVKNSPDVLGALQKYVELTRRYAEIRRDYQLVKIRLLSLLEK